METAVAMTLVGDNVLSCGARNETAHERVLIRNDDVIITRLVPSDDKVKQRTEESENQSVENDLEKPLLDEDDRSKNPIPAKTKKGEPDEAILPPASALIPTTSAENASEKLPSSCATVNLNLNVPESVAQA